MLVKDIPNKLKPQATFSFPFLLSSSPGPVYNIEVSEMNTDLSFILSNVCRDGGCV